MASVTIHSDFGTQENKICYCFYFFPFYLLWVMRSDAIILGFFNAEFQASFFTTRHIHNWVSFPLWPSLFILFGVISNHPLLFPGSTVDTFWPEVLISNVVSFCLFTLFMGFLRPEYCSGLLFPPLVDHICLNSSLWPVCLGWPCSIWLTASLSYARPITTRRQWSTKVGRGWHILRYL